MGFYFEVARTDKVQAKQDLEYCSTELSKYQNLSRSGLKRHQMIAIDEIMIELKERIKNEIPREFLSLKLAS
ncbi:MULTISPECIES: hypothetical protein [Acinetobacter]|uniref:hypothetical protein n=1 Tax=Acinetobacter TaxID=469 RepID=UPI0009002114|nr:MULTISPECIES: hypothetical protein [Acinetobacter]OIU82513.1 hypothetical protein BFN00_02480 [Acinetobacter sp. AR2-3]